MQMPDAVAQRLLYAPAIIRFGASSCDRVALVLLAAVLLECVGVSSHVAMP